MSSATGAGTVTGQGVHRDQVLRRDPVGDPRPVSPTRQVLEPAPGKRHPAGRQTCTEVTPQIHNGSSIGDEGVQPLRERP